MLDLEEDPLTLLLLLRFLLRASRRLLRVMCKTEACIFTLSIYDGINVGSVIATAADGDNDGGEGDNDDYDNDKGDDDDEKDRTNLIITPPPSSPFYKIQ